MKNSEANINNITDYSRAFETTNFSILSKNIHAHNLLYWVYDYVTEKWHCLQKIQFHNSKNLKSIRSQKILQWSKKWIARYGTMVPQYKFRKD